MPSRRALLAALGGTTTATAGCIDRLGGPFETEADRRIAGACDQPTGAWPTAGGDSRRTGRSDTSLPPTETEGRRVSLGRRDDGQPRLASGLPAVADGRAFVPSGRELVAVDLASPDAEPAWVHGTGDDVDAVPAMACGAVLAPGVNTLTAVDPVTGDRYWQAEVGGVGPAALGVIADRVYVGGPTVVAVDARTGDQRWTADGGDTVAVDGTGVYSTENANGNGGIYAHDHDGTRRWHRPLGKMVASATVRDGTVYAVDTAGTVHALDAASGETDWSRRLDGVEKVHTGLAARGEALVVPAGTGERSVVLDAASGEPDWWADTGIVTGRPVVGDDWIAIGWTNHGVTVYDRASGAERATWTREAYDLGTIDGLVPLERGLLVRGGTTSGLTLLR
jgi:outer membrane protein assembly factor BamB